jgi:hypothetical protein
MFQERGEANGGAGAHRGEPLGQGPGAEPGWWYRGGAGRSESNLTTASVLCVSIKGCRSLSCCFEVCGVDDGEEIQGCCWVCGPAMAPSFAFVAQSPPTRRGALAVDYGVDVEGINVGG